MYMKYPKGIKPGKYFNSRKSKPDNRVKYGQRGMTLEKDLDITNNYYLQTSRAVIHKKPTPVQIVNRSEEHTSELQSRGHLVCRLLLEKKKYKQYRHIKR